VEENISLPLSSEETQQQWFAGSRISTSCFGAFTWSASSPAGKYWSFHSRVLDKTQTWACCLVMQIVMKLKLKPRSTLVLWMDCGPHFRGYRFVSSISLWCAELGINTIFRWGAEHHMKGKVDGFFGWMAGAISSWRRTHTLTDCDDIVMACQAYQNKATSKGGSEYEFVSFIPPPKDSIRQVVYKTSCFAQPLKATQELAFTCNDWRRQSLYGRGLGCTTLTGLSGSARLLPGGRTQAGFTFVPVVYYDSEWDKTEKTPDLPEPESDAECDKELQLSEQAKDFEGWRLSWRSSAPENMTYHDFLARLRWKRGKMEGHGMLEQPRRRGVAAPSAAVAAPLSGAPDPEALSLFFDE
jgi:hypothetical protein